MNAPGGAVTGRDYKRRWGSGGPVEVQAVTLLLCRGRVRVGAVWANGTYVDGNQLFTYRELPVPLSELELILIPYGARAGAPRAGVCDGDLGARAMA